MTTIRDVLTLETDLPGDLNVALWSLFGGYGHGKAAGIILAYVDAHGQPCIVCANAEAAETVKAALQCDLIDEVRSFSQVGGRVFVWGARAGAPVDIRALIPPVTLGGAEARERV